MVDITKNFSDLLVGEKRKYVIYGEKNMDKSFKPKNDKKIRLRIIPPEGGITARDIEEIDKLIKVDFFEGNIKIGRYRLCDIKAKLK
jgi:hypothetical protein